MIFLKKYFVSTTGEIDVLSIIHDIRYAVRDAKATEGLVTVIIPSSGAGLVIIEPLPEVIEQLKQVKASMLTRTLTIPLANHELVMAPREEVMLVNIEPKMKRREFAIQVLTLPPEKAEPPKRGVAPARR